MRNNETGEFELVVGNRQLLSAFFIVVLLFAVAFAMGYMVGQNSPKSGKAAGGERAPAAAIEHAARMPVRSRSPAAGSGAPRPPPSRRRAPPDAALRSRPRSRRRRRSRAKADRRRRPRPARSRRPPAPAGAGRICPPATYWQVMAVATADRRDDAHHAQGHGFPVIAEPRLEGPDARAGGALSRYAERWARPRPSWKRPASHPRPVHSRERSAGSDRRRPAMRGPRACPNGRARAARISNR